jgi:hypothetical protein
MSLRRNKPKVLKRQYANRPERKTVIIFCEGEASEPDYINALKRLPEIRSNTSISIEIDPGWGVPLTLVKRAVERSREDEVDECWCVFDVEWPKNHPNLKRAVQLADQHGIRLAISNPCFELWLILHYEHQAAFMSTKEAERKSRSLDGRAGKRISAEHYMKNRRAAAQRAAGLADLHSQNDSVFPRNNPSSTMCDLLAAVEPHAP